MAVKAISEFTIQPDRRDEFVRLFETLVAQHLESMRATGCHSATIYVVVDDPAKAVEISEWDSAEARERMMQSEAIGRVCASVRAAGRSPQCDGGGAAALDGARAAYS